MMTSSNGNIFRVTGPLCGEFTGPRWIPLTKASDAELWCFLWSAPWINGWVNNREAGDLKRHRDHYDVIEMMQTSAVSGRLLKRDKHANPTTDCCCNMKDKLRSCYTYFHVSVVYIARNTVRCHLNAVNFDPNPDKLHPITQPWGRDMRCRLWI